MELPPHTNPTYFEMKSDAGFAYLQKSLRSSRTENFDQPEVLLPPPMLVTRQKVS
jgi:hypothetical protein